MTPYHQESKIIIYAWVNDTSSKRAYDSSADAYKVFRKMLESGYPPDDWEQLVKEAKAEQARLQRAAETEI
jgi:toxin YhaV